MSVIGVSGGSVYNPTLHGGDGVPEIGGEGEECVRDGEGGDGGGGS